MEKIPLAYGIPSETVAVIMMLYKNTLFRSPDGDTSFFDINAGVLQGDTLAPILFVISLDFVLRTLLDKHHHLCFTLSPRLSSRYAPEKLTDVDYADDLAITADTITNATVLLHNLENATNEVGLYVNASKAKFISFNQQGSIQTVSGESTELVESFIYLGSEINSTKKDMKIRIAKAWTALNKMDTIWKSALFIQPQTEPFSCHC